MSKGYLRNVVNEAYITSKPSTNKVYVIIANNEMGEERIMSIYTDAAKAKKTLSELQEVGYGDWDEFRLDYYTPNDEPFRANLDAREW